MATKVITVNLREEIEKVLKKLQQGADEVNVGVLTIKNNLEHADIVFTFSELVGVLNGMLRSGAISFCYLGYDENLLDAVVSYGQQERGLDQ